jgi:hypothetical protein
VQKLHLVGFTTDQKGLILSARRGTRSGSYHVTVDDELAEAVEELRAKQAEVEAEAEVEAARPARVESALSVKEIQARLRQGRALNEVAKAAGVDPEWVERFAAPVFAERAQVIALVQARPLKRARLGASSHPIGEALRRNLAERGVSISPEEFNDGWSARQLADGRWAVRFRYHHRSRDHVLRFDLDEATGAVVAADRPSGQLGYVTPPERPTAKAARPKPAPAPPQGDRPPKRATVTVGFRPDAGGATSPAARERERASEAMRKAAAQRAVEAEKAAARRARERAEQEARAERERQAAEARRLREEQAAEARRAREQAAKERARALEARKKAAAAKRLADQRAKEKAAKERKKAAAAKKRAAERARAKAAKQRADQAKRAEAALRAAERRAAAASKKKATSSGARKAAAKKASASKASTKKGTRASASRTTARAAATAANKVTGSRAAAKSSTKATAVPASKAAAPKPAKAPAAKATTAKPAAVPAAKVPAEKAPSVSAPVVEVPTTPAVSAPAASPTSRPTAAAPKPLFAPGALRPVPPQVPMASTPLDENATGDVRILGPATREPDAPRAPATPPTTTPLLFRAGVVEATSEDGNDRPHPAAVLGSGGNGRARARPPGARRTRPLRAT